MPTPAGRPTTSTRYRILIRRHNETGWTVWGRFSSNAERTHHDATWLTTQPDTAEVNIQRTTVTEDHLTIEELRTLLLDAPPQRRATPDDVSEKGDDR
ncbi:hypothetical protein ACFUGD_01915 [Streptomyces sp. NPDC057217]|uniref:hypothetical protein n=1 Tax=Streptomyces sp. NPDC057217 TaxID=3346054 RepID=UPI0036272465